jgi:hypothetical protein
VHHYFFVAAFLDPRTKPLLKDIMTNLHLSQLKKDIVNLMVAEGERKKQIQIDNQERNKEGRGSETASVNLPATAASHRVASMFQGLNTMSAEQQVEDNEDEEEDMIRNICYAEFQRYKNVSIDLHNIEGSFNDALAWWKRNDSKYPLLAMLAHECLAIPATSASSERIWSRASRILSLKRASLKPEVAQQIMFVKENLSILRKHYHTLAMRERSKDRQFMVEYEMSYLPPLEGLSLEDDKNGQIIDVGQSDE